MRVITWNIKKSMKAKPKITRKLEELYNGDWRGVICLQEVSRAQALEISSRFSDAGVYYACDIWPRSSYRREIWGNLTILKNLSGLNPHVLQFLPHPEKSLVVTIEANDCRWDVINFHSVTGVGHTEKKGKQYFPLFNYLKAAGDHLVLCGDMNEPKIDSLNYEDIECWSRSPGNREAAESVIKGRNVHGMIDAHIEYIRDIGGRSLVPTYRNGNNERRYDHIFVRGHKSIRLFKVESVDPAISDHSIVRCEIELKDA